MLKRKEQQQVDKADKFIEDIKALKAVKDIDQDVEQLEGSLIPSYLALNQSAFMQSVLEGDPGFLLFYNTKTQAVSSFQGLQLVPMRFLNINILTILLGILPCVQFLNV